jgi:hypothetical protein
MRVRHPKVDTAGGILGAGPRHEGACHQLTGDGLVRPGGRQHPQRFQLTAVSGSTGVAPPRRCHAPASGAAWPAFKGSLEPGQAAQR